MENNIDKIVENKIIYRCITIKIDYQEMFPCKNVQ